jgi:hypothetical protein
MQYFIIIFSFCYISIYGHYCEAKVMKFVLVKNVVQIMNVIYGPTLDRLYYFHF